MKSILTYILSALNKRITVREIWEWFKSFFSDTDGASTTRLLNWMWCSTICFVVIFATVKSGGHLPDLNAYYVSITTAFLGAKIGQKYFESKDNTTDSTGDQPTKPTL